VAGAVVVLALSACGDDRPGPVLPPVPSSGSASATASPAPSPSVRPTGTAEEQILGQYRRFWTEALPSALAAPEPERRDILRTVVAEPLLAELLRVARLFDVKNEVANGIPVLIHQTVSREAREAVVVGCVDMSTAVRTDRQTGKITYRGKPRDPTHAYFTVGSDGVWRVYSLDEPEGSRC
jgi:hypothetical protein